MIRHMQRLPYCLIFISAVCFADDENIKQYADKTAETIASPAKDSNYPDESLLWALFHAGKIDVLRYQIRSLQRRYPNWLVPADLQNALQKTKKPVQAKSLKSSYPKKHLQVPICSNLDRKWERAAAYAFGQKYEQSLRLYKSLLVICRDQGIKETTLKKAGAHLPHDEFMQLADFSADYLPSDALGAIKYDWLKNTYLQNPPTNLAEQKRAAETLIEPIQNYQDSNLASVIAWRFFDFQDFENALHWFDIGDNIGIIKSGKSSGSGKLLALEKLGQYDQLLALYAKIETPDADMQAIVARVYKLKAWQAIDSGNFALAQQNVSNAERIVGQDVETQEINAWIANHNKQFAKSAQLFESLYQQSPRREYAQAFVQNQAKADKSVLNKKRTQYGGMVADEYNKLNARELYYRKQFLTAEVASPSLFPNLANIDAPYVDLGGYARYKTGESGLGELTMQRVPAMTLSYTFADIHEFKFSVSRMALDAGGDKGLTNQLNDGVETEFLYRMDGWLSPYLRLGNTPTNGVITPIITFDVGFMQQINHGNLGLSLYSQPVRQSILSYTGVRNSENQEWGRVLRSGIKANSYYRLNDRWSMSGSADVAMLKGENVKDNTAVAFTTGFARNFAVPGFDYLNVGPSFMFEHYDKNLSYFEQGHGGYFSPEQYYNLGFGVQFLTEEGKPFVIKGHAVAGFQSSKEDESAFSNPDKSPCFERKCPARNNFGDALDLEAKGVWLFTANIQLGGGFGIRHTSNYEDYTGGLFIRYFFEDRKASYSNDIPYSMFSNMQTY